MCRGRFLCNGKQLGGSQVLSPGYCPGDFTAGADGVVQAAFCAYQLKQFDSGPALLGKRRSLAAGTDPNGTTPGSGEARDGRRDYPASRDAAR